MDIALVRQKAEQEIAEEEFRSAVDKYKAKLKLKRSWLDKVFPYKVMVIKKEDLWA